MSKARAYGAGILAFLAFSIGGPAFMYWVRPTDEELFERFSPELKKRNLENRDRREREFDEFVGKLKEYSKSDKPIWVVAAQEEKRKREQLQQATQTRLLEDNKIRDELLAQRASTSDSKRS